MIRFRKMVPGDVDAALALCRAANWNQLERDWLIFLQQGPEDCRVATIEDRVVGTVTTIRYNAFFSWIGMVLVDPAHQRQGIGISLLKEALHILQEEETIKLDATPAGRQVYIKLGFADEYGLTRMQGAIPMDLDRGNTRPVQIKDLPAIAEFDRPLFGADRGSLLQWMFAGMPSLAFIVKENDQVLGYSFGRPGKNFFHIGPVAAINIVIAKNLVAAAAHACAGKSIIIDTMHFDPEWVHWLGTIGLNEQRSFTRMYKGTNSHPGIPEKQFAVLGPEFG